MTPVNNFNIKQLKQLAIINNISEILSKNNIPFTILKGLSISAVYYAHLEDRQSNDIDILIEPQNMAKAVAVIKNGFTDIVLPEGEFASVKLSDYNFKFIIAGEMLELHWALAPFNKYEINVSLLLSETEKFPINGSILPIMSPTYLLCALLIHAAKSYFSNLADKHYTDFSLILEKDNINWRQLTGLLLKANCATSSLVFLTDIIQPKCSIPREFIKTLNKHKIKVKLLKKFIQNKKLFNLVTSRLIFKQLLLGPLLVDSTLHFCFVSWLYFLKKVHFLK